MNNLSTRITFVVLTALLIGGFPNFMAQEAHATVNSMTFVNIVNDNRMSGDGTVVYTLTGTLANENAVAGTITFVRTGGTADATTHTYTMTVGGGENDLASTSGGNAITKDVTELQADAGFADLVSGTIYTVTVEITNPALAAVAKTGVTFDNVRPTMDSASKTSLTTIDITFSEDILDAEASDFTLDGVLTVASISETGGVVTITTNQVMGNDVTPIVTLGGDFVTDVINVGTVNTAIAASVIATDNDGVTSKNGSGCDGDCEEPTLGMDSNGRQIVKNGFTYNGNPTNVERFFTPYPLITANVGKQNTAVFKIYENMGPENVKHFSFAFGLDKSDIISNSKAMIELDIDHEGTETVTVTDPENALDNIKVSTNIGNCNEGDSDTQCLIVTINHMFRAPLDFNIVVTDVWDMKRNSWQNYYNHGIEVTGESLNPAKIHDGINAGQIYHLTETSKTTAVDEFGDTWSFQYGIWEQDYVKNERVQDTSSVFNRMHSDFAEYKELQAQNAIPQLLEYCPSCLDSFIDFDDSFSYEYSNELNKLDNLEIIQRMLLENERAQKIMNYLLDPVKYSK
ncbi:MAG: hypothetical protein COA77_03645 [Thaumarchaeota archaeon]|nr:MAG: hypothetical protein COA77_03645 [Nitrososphaerota archaeon]